MFFFNSTLAIDASHKGMPALTQDPRQRDGLAVQLTGGLVRRASRRQSEHTEQKFNNN
jgi:hypothetical protein